MFRKIFILIFISFFLISCAVQSEHKRDFIIDNLGLLNSNEKQTLENILLMYEKDTTNEIVILIIGALNKEDLNDYAKSMHNILRVGKMKYRNGVLIVVVKEDRKVRINVGDGLTNSLTNDKCEKILENFTLPFFRKDKYFEGLKQTITQIKNYAKNNWE